LNRRLFGRKDFLHVTIAKNIIEDYDMKTAKILGKGAFAEVKLVVNKMTGVKHVVK